MFWQRKRNLKQWLIGFWIIFADRNLGDSIILALPEPINGKAIDGIEELIENRIKEIYPYIDFRVKVFSVQRLPR